MATTSDEKIKQLEQEVKLLRSAVIGLVKEDPEGEYRPEFVNEVLRAMEEEPEYTFTSKEQFLKDIADTDV